MFQHRLLIVADDLTGAIDTGVQFSRAAVSTLVTTTGESANAGPTVLAVDIESRHLTSAQSADRVTRCVESARQAGFQLFYKKTDSTLRGNVGAELAALLRAAGGQRVYFAPALPAAGRVTRGGIQLVHGVPVQRSAYSRDTADPVREASVGAIIRSQTDIPVISIPRGADPGPILAERSGPSIVVFDAETDDDLAQIAGRLAALPPPLLLAGSAGFASVLPDALGLPKSPAAAASLPPPLLVVCGSRNAVSRSQVHEAEAQGISSWQAGPGAPAIDTAAVAARLNADGIAILKTPGEHSPESTRDVVRLATAIWRGEGGTIAAFGGDTAFAVIEHLDVRGIEPLREICQGTVACRLAGAPGSGRGLITKAGGFGPLDVIQRMREALGREE